MTQVRPREAQRIFEAAVARYQMYPEYRDTGIEWLGQIPAHWDTVRLKYACHASALYGANLSANEYVNDGVRFLRTSDIDDFGNLIDANAVYVDPLTVQNYLLRDGDILLSRSGTIGRSFVYEAQKHEPSAYAGYLVRFVPNDLLVSRFAFYFTKSQAYYDWITVNVIESTIGNLNGQKYANMPLTLPPPDEQRAIAAFLDRQTAKIDALIAKKRELIAALHEKRSAIISHAVTKGLNPDAPMKDSGIEWLGEIPAGWEVVRVKFIASSLQTGPFGSQLHSDEYIVGGIPVVNPSHLKNGRIVGDENVTVDEETWAKLSRHQLLEGDIVFARRGEMGRAAIVTENEVGWLCGTGSIRVRLLHDFCYPPYVNIAFSLDGVKDWLNIESVGSTMENLNTQIIGELPIPLPPVDEQRAVATHLDEETAKIDILMAKVEATIERLQEYRSALISAAVTGKIDVRTG